MNGKHATKSAKNSQIGRAVGDITPQSGDNIYVIGVDEVGRGPIAGPVAVGAFVFLDPSARRQFRGVKESKQLTESQREAWFKIIQEYKKTDRLNFTVIFKSEKIIDTKGLSYAIRSALANSLSTLNLPPDQCKILLDGGLKAPTHYENQKTIVKGDEKEMVIALASICAKVLRDRRMNKFAAKYAQYGFEVHKGYGTKKHYEAIGKYGMLPIHRRSFLSKLLNKSSREG